MSLRSPIDFEELIKDHPDEQILRAGMFAELDIVSLYEQLAVMTEDINIKRTFLDIVKVEKIHLNKFKALLLKKTKNKK